MYVFYSYDCEDQLEQWRRKNLDVGTFRKIIVSLLNDHPDMVANYDMPPDWYEKMQIGGTHCDYFFQSLTADYLHRNIILVSVLPQDGHDKRGEIVIESKSKDNNKQDLYLLYYHEGSFHNGHFQSIRPLE